MKLTALLVTITATTGVLSTPLSPDQTPNEPRAAALGINCRGSALCSDARAGKNAASRLQSFINAGIQGNRVYRNGEHIACVDRTSLAAPSGGFCAFLQGTNRDVNGNNIRDLIGQIVGHGCKVCGSVPIDFPGSNDPKNGILTVNYVSSTDNPCPEGLC